MVNVVTRQRVMGQGRIAAVIIALQANDFILKGIVVLKFRDELVLEDDIILARFFGKGEAG